MPAMTLANRTAVVVSAHRLYPTLLSCLKGFHAIVDRPEDLIYVNNGASESLRRQVAEMLPGISIIHLKQNRLFCGGYNAGIQAALDKDYDFVLLVNADTEVMNAGFVHELLAAARRWPKAAFLGPLVYYRNRETIQNTRFRFPSVLHHIVIWVPWRLFPGRRSNSPLTELQVGFLNGVCILCRCAALRDIGLMDEQYGGYVEDADWSWRASKKGWSSVSVPVPSIIHHEEQEGYEYFSFKSFLLKRNTVLWNLKSGRRTAAIAYGLASLCLAGLRTLRAKNSDERRQYCQFFRRLNKSYQAMIFGKQAPGGSDHKGIFMTEENWNNGPR
jgi:N-acetylglucosaminyl-diphospho-decaprenol L-rhamnosyltransferase